MDIIDERYKNGKIYKIVCNETGETYYGSTIQKLNKRMNEHRSKKKVCMSRQIIDRNNYYCELIEDYSCNNRYELETRERWYIENNACINKQIPTRTKKEWRKNNKEYLKEWFNQYYEDNKEKSKEYYKEYRQNNKEKSKEYNKEYYQQNKEKLLEYQKIYAEQNKEKKAQYKKIYAEQNKEKLKEYKKQYYQSNKKKE
jgi:hypothetical protein